MNKFRPRDDVDVKGKRVLLRVDLNVPMEDGRVTDATRIERVAPTITELADKGGKVILLVHFGVRQGRQGHPARPLWSPERGRPQGFASTGRGGGREDHRPQGRLCRGLHRI